MKQRTSNLLFLLLMAISVACGGRAATPEPIVTNPPTAIVEPTDVPATEAVPTATAEQQPTDVPTEEPAAVMPVQDAIDDAGALVRGAEGALDRVATAPEYDIAVAVDYAAATYSGAQVVKFTNNEDVALDALYFRLFPNGGSSYGDGSLSASDVMVNGAAVETTLSQDDTVLEIKLAAPLAVGESAEITLNFNGVIASNGSGYGMFSQPNICTGKC